MITRRQFTQGLVTLALGGLATHVNALTRGVSAVSSTLGPLQPDPNGILDLPAGFSYRIISKLGDSMKDGLTVPDRADGMGCIPLDDQRVALVRNHELQPKHSKNWDVAFRPEQRQQAYDTDKAGRPLSGGTSTIVYNTATQQVEQQFMSLLGTIRNCAGGTTPWGSWLTCEESVARASSENNKDHGYVFEVPATATGLVNPKPIKAMGRFNHEAACVDPNTGIVYLTEDRNDSLFYRFIPAQPGKLHQGGTLQALMIKDTPQFDTRNWSAAKMSVQRQYPCEWITLDNVDSPEDDLRERGYNMGAARFARGEGIFYDEQQVYFCCTSGGAEKLGQIMRYSTTGNTLDLFMESTHPTEFNFGDNLCVAPNGHLVVCEDQYSAQVNNHLKGVNHQGQTYDIGKVRWQTEPAGVCFSPDGSTLFVNLYSPTATLAISGPWQNLSA